MLALELGGRLMPKVTSENATRLLPAARVVGAPVTAAAFTEQISQIVDWAHKRESRMVCVANVHMLMEAVQDPEFAMVLEEADMVTPDGMPLVWMMRKQGFSNQDRVAGLDIMNEMFARAQVENLSIFFLGSTDQVLEQLRGRLSKEYPSLRIAGMYSPPFRTLSGEETCELIELLNKSEANLVFVAFGCPKQERWMHAVRPSVKAVLCGLGGAFPVYAGVQKRAPKWIRRAGLEWFFRLAQEPRRLWRRYWNTNIPFIWLAIRQMIRAGGSQ